MNKNYSLDYIEIFLKLKDLDIHEVILHNTYKVKTYSKGYVVAMRDEFTCKKCKCKATHLVLKKERNNNNTHFIIMSDDVLMTRDHIIPKAKYGSDNIENSQLLCHDCNSIKGDMDNDEFMKIPLNELKKNVTDEKYRKYKKFNKFIHDPKKFIEDLKSNSREAIKILNNLPEEMLKDFLLMKPEFLRHIEKQSEGLCLHVLKRFPTRIKDVKEQTPILCFAAVTNYPQSIRYVRNQTEDLCIIAVQKHWINIRYIKSQFQTPVVKNLARSKSKQAEKYIVTDNPRKKKEK